MTTEEKIKQALEQAQNSVVNIEDNEIRNIAFEVILKYLLESLPSQKPLGEKETVKKITPSVTSNDSDEDFDASSSHSKIVEKIKTVDEAENIEKHILARSSQVDRTLLPLYIVHEYFGNKFGLTSGDINKISTELGTPISVPNASGTLSGTASKYVIGDALRKKGGVVRYKLHRRGVDYMKSVILGNSNENEA